MKNPIKLLALTAIVALPMFSFASEEPTLYSQIFNTTSYPVQVNLNTGQDASLSYTIQNRTSYYVNLELINNYKKLNTVTVLCDTKNLENMPSLGRPTTKMKCVFHGIAPGVSYFTPVLCLKGSVQKICSAGDTLTKITVE